MYETGYSVPATGSAALIQKESIERLNRAQTDAPRVPLVSREMNELNRRADVIEKLVSHLEERISGVLRPVQPSPVREGSNGESAHVQVAAHLAEVNARLESASNRLSSILDRIEL